MRAARRGNEKLSFCALGDRDIGGISRSVVYRLGVARLDALDELLVREDRVAEEGLHVAEKELHSLRISIFDCGVFLEYD